MMDEILFDNTVDEEGRFHRPKHKRSMMEQDYTECEGGYEDEETGIPAVES